MVLEKDTVGEGVSGHTTGKITSQHNLIYNKLASRLGEKTARLYGEANQQAIDKYRILSHLNKSYAIGVEKITSCIPVILLGYKNLKTKRQ